MENVLVKKELEHSGLLPLTRLVPGFSDWNLTEDETDGLRVQHFVKKLSESGGL